MAAAFSLLLQSLRLSVYRLILSLRLFVPAPLPPIMDPVKHTVTSLGQSSFRTVCDINGTQSDLIISSGSASNLASKSLVSNLGIPMLEHPNPYKLNELIVDEQISVYNQAKIRLSVRCIEGFYEDEILFDVVPMREDCIVLGRPWQFDMNVIYYGNLNRYEFEVNGQSLVLRSDTESNSGRCEINKSDCFCGL